MLISIIGALAGITSVTALIPQIYKTYKTKSAVDLSWLMLINFFACSVLWVVYGILTDAGSVWYTNVALLVFNVILIVFKYKYGRDKVRA